MAPQLIALIGLDGVGKTSLVTAAAAAVAARGLRVTALPRGPACVERRFEALLPRQFNDHRDWLDSEFNRAIALACAVDYAGYHRETIAPALSNTEAPRILLADRHAICFRAFAQIGRPPSAMALAVLDAIPPADLYVWVNASPATIAQRLAHRTGPKDPFEHPQAQSALLCGYEACLPTIFDRLMLLDNDEALAVVADRLADRIIGHLASPGARR
jgi:thymidylate kinase